MEMLFGGAGADVVRRAEQGEYTDEKPQHVERKQSEEDIN